MKLHFLVILLALSACGQKAIVRPVDVNIPVPVPCHIEKPEEPHWFVPEKKDKDTPEQIIAMMADLDNAHGYIAELEAAIGACQ